MIVRWLGNSSLEIRGEKNLLIDPSFKYEPVTEPDLILVSHEHDDHINPDQVKKFSDAKLFAPLSVFEDFNIEGEIVKPGEIIEDDIKVLDIDCYNARSSVAYFYQGVYQTGDAASFPYPEEEVKVLFTACFPDFYSEYIDCCHRLEPELVIPYHFDPEDEKGIKAAQELAERLEKEGFAARLLQLGQEILV